MRRILVVAAGVALATLAGCSGGGGSQDAAATASPSAAGPTASPTAGSPGVEGPGAASGAATVPTAAWTPTDPASMQTVTADPSASVTPLATPSAGLRSVGGSTLPSSFAGYTGAVSGRSGKQQAMYTGATEDQMLMVELAEGDAATAARGLTGVTVVGDATCGTVQGVATCVAPLQGGYLSVQGTDRDSAASLGATTGKLLAALG